MQRWIDLLSKLELTGLDWTVTVQQLDDFERYIGFPFPKEYREFCKVFGRESFLKHIISFWCVPPLRELWEGAVINELDIRSSQLWVSSFSEDLLDFKSLKDNSYIFAKGRNSIFLSGI